MEVTKPNGSGAQPTGNHLHFDLPKTATPEEVSETTFWLKVVPTKDTEELTPKEVAKSLRLHTFDGLKF